MLLKDIFAEDDHLYDETSKGYFWGEFIHGRFGAGINISVDKVLQNQLWVFEVTGMVVIGLSVNFSQSLSQIFLPPDKFLEVLIKKNLTFMLEQILILFNELLTSEPAVFIKEINFKHLLLVLSIGRTEQSCDHKRKIVP